MGLGAGFNPEFTGRENITFNARVYGIEEEMLQQKINDIIEFAELGRFIDAPVKYYSQGMYMRLAFALAIFVDPEILLVDDILAVGDEQARQKCIKKIFELKEAGKTIVLVSHDMEMVRQLCDRVILLKGGRRIREGKPEAVISYYLETVGKKEGVGVLEKGGVRATFNNGHLILRYGDEVLTPVPGAYAALFMPSVNNWCSSVNFFWRIPEASPDRLVAVGRSPDGAWTQEWSLAWKDEGLEMKIKMRGEEFREAHLDLLLSSSYDRWATLEAEGVFPEFAHKDQWQNLGLKSYLGGLLGFFPQACLFRLPGLCQENKKT